VASEAVRTYMFLKQTQFDDTLETDFGATASTFQDTAARVQNLLAEVTPDQVIVATDSLPAIFNDWLTNLISTYPAGCQ